MNPTALRARLDSRGYIPVSHAPADHPEEWFDLDGKAGSIRVITCPGDGNPIEVLGLGPRPAGLALFGIRLSASTPEQLIIAVLNTAETWLTGDPAASPPRLPSPQAAAPGPGSALRAATRGGLTAYLTASPGWTPDGTWRGCQAWRHAATTPSTPATRSSTAPSTNCRATRLSARPAPDLRRAGTTTLTPACQPPPDLKGETR